MVFLGHQLIKSWSASQNAISLSSGEAKYYAMTKAGSNAIGIRSVLQGIGVAPQIRCLTDATPRTEIEMRRRIGKLKHLGPTQLRVQQKVRNKSCDNVQIKNHVNSAGLLTKHLTQSDMIE